MSSGLEKPRWLVLVGMMGTGKSSLGQALARRTGLPFTDLDERVVARLGRPIHEALPAMGEAAFRELESEVLADVLSGPGGILALGGGTFCSERNRRALHAASAWTVLLEASVPELMRRAHDPAGTRPLAPKDAAGWERMLAERKPHYDRAHTSLQNDGISLDEAVDLLLAQPLPESAR